MANKTVMSLDLYCDKCKKVALHSVTKIDGIDSLSIDMKEGTLTVIGDADPVCVANLLRKKFRCAKLVSAGPVPPPKPKEEKKEEKKVEKKEEKKEEEKKEEKKEEEKKEEKKEEEKKEEKKDEAKPAVSPYPLVYPVCQAQCYPPCPACSHRPEILWPRYRHPCAPSEVVYVWSEEKQDACTIM